MAGRCRVDARPGEWLPNAPRSARSSSHPPHHARQSPQPLRAASPTTHLPKNTSKALTPSCRATSQKLRSDPLSQPLALRPVRGVGPGGQGTGQGQPLGLEALGHADPVSRGIRRVCSGLLCSAVRMCAPPSRRFRSRLRRTQPCVVCLKP